MAFFRDFYFKTQTYILASSFWIICTRRLHIHKEVNFFFFSRTWGAIVYIYTHTGNSSTRVPELSRHTLETFLFYLFGFPDFFFLFERGKAALVSLSLSFSFCGTDVRRPRNMIHRTLHSVVLTNSRQKKEEIPPKSSVYCQKKNFVTHWASLRSSEKFRWWIINF